MQINIEDEVKGIQSENDKIREKHFDNLLLISENDPSRLYKFWDIWIKMLRKPEVSNKYYAIHLIANLLFVDKESKFEKIFKEFYKLIDHESPVVAPHIAAKSGKIINAKPNLSNKICKHLLNIDSTSKCKQLELQKAYVIDAFDLCYDNVKNKNEVITFIKDQLKSESPKTRKKAKEFLGKYKIT